MRWLMRVREGPRRASSYVWFASNDTGNVTVRPSVLCEVRAGFLDKRPRVGFNCLSGEVLISRHFGRVLAERVIWAQALHNVVFIWGSTDVEMPRLNMELTHVLNARAGRAELDEIVDDAVSDKCRGDACGG